MFLRSYQVIAREDLGPADGIKTYKSPIEMFETSDIPCKDEPFGTTNCSDAIRTKSCNKNLFYAKYCCATCIKDKQLTFEFRNEIIKDPSVLETRPRPPRPTPPPLCKDNKFFEDCNLVISDNKYCNREIYAKQCCRSCLDAGQITQEKALEIAESIQ